MRSFVGVKRSSPVRCSGCAGLQVEGYAVFDLRQPIALGVRGIRGDQCVAPQEFDDGLNDCVYRFSGLRRGGKSTIESSMPP